jgi:hypothetical protein
MHDAFVALHHTQVQAEVPTRCCRQFSQTPATQDKQTAMESLIGCANNPGPDFSGVTSSYMTNAQHKGAGHHARESG